MGRHCRRESSPATSGGHGAVRRTRRSANALMHSSVAASFPRVAFTRNMHVVQAFFGAGHQADIDRDVFARQHLGNEIHVVFQVEGAGAVGGVVLRRESHPVMQGVARIVEKSDVPAHVHVAVAVAIALGHGSAQAYRIEGDDFLQGNGRRLQYTSLTRMPVVWPK